MPHSDDRGGPPVQPNPTWDRKRVGILAFAHGVVDSYGGFLAPLFPLLVAKLGLSLTLVGSLAATAQVSSSLAQPLYGYWSDRMRKGYLLVAGPALAALFWSTIGFAPNYATIVLLLILGGVGVASFHPQGAALVGSVSRKRGGLGISLFSMGGSIGYSSGPLLAAAIVSGYGLESLAFAMIPGLLTSFVMYRYAFASDVHMRRRNDTGQSGDSFRTRRGPLTLLCGIVLLRALVNGVFMNFLPLLLAERGSSLVIGGISVFVFLFPGSFGGVLGGHLSDRLGRKRVLIFSMAACLPFFYTSLFASGQVLSLILLACAGFLISSSTPVNIIMAQELVPGRASTASSLMMGFGWGLGALLITPFGMLADAFGIVLILYIAAGLPALGLLLATFLPETRSDTQHSGGISNPHSAIDPGRKGMFWEREIETMPEQDLRALQVSRLREAVDRAIRVPYYETLLGETRISPEHIRTLDDLRRIPFTTKEHLREHFPYGFLGAPQEEIVRLHSSSGTTGNPTVIYHTRGDIEDWANLVARCIYTVGVRDTDVFQNMMGYGLFTGGLGLHYGAEKLGALTIPAGAGNSRRQIWLMQNFGTTVIHIVPSYALYLATVFEELGVDPKRDVHLRIAFIGAEPHSESTRERLQELYGIHAYNSYGLSEMNGPGVAFECTEQEGMHVWEDTYILEVIDRHTLEPLKEGEEGELVFTHLTRRGTPLLRYRTKDLAFVYPEPCRCGRTHRRISRITGRSDDMLIVKGVNIFPIQIERTLMQAPEVGNNYLIVLERVGDADDMIVRIEVRGEVLAGGLRQLERLRHHLVARLRDEILITPKVELVEPNTLPTSEGKAVRVIDNREI